MFVLLFVCVSLLSVLECRGRKAKYIKKKSRSTNLTIVNIHKHTF